jgi:ectoine hydroxylase
LSSHSKKIRHLEKYKNKEEVIEEPYSKEIRSIFDIHKSDKILGNLTRNKKLVEIAKIFLGSDIYIHQSRINYKPGFRGKEFYWHSDFETWHAEDGMPKMRAVSCSITLDDNYEFNGPLMVIPGSHNYFVSCVGETPDDHYKKSLKQQEYGTPNSKILTDLVSQNGIDVPKGRAGSVLFFECNLIHGSNSNITPYPRTNVFFVFNSTENILKEPFYASKARPEYIANRSDYNSVEGIYTKSHL